MEVNYGETVRSMQKEVFVRYLDMYSHIIVGGSSSVAHFAEISGKKRLFFHSSQSLHNCLSIQRIRLSWMGGDFQLIHQIVCHLLDRFQAMIDWFRT